MAAIGHKAVFQNTVQTQLGTTFTTKLTLSNADIVASAKYLLLVYAQVGAASAFTRAQCRVRHGSTAFTGSLMIYDPAGVATAATPALHSYGYMTVFTDSGASEDITFELAGQAGTTTAYADSIAIFIMRLDADLVEGPDWQFSEDTTAVQYVSPSFFIQHANVDITASSGESWLVIADASYQVFTTSTSQRYSIRESIGATTNQTVPDWQQEGEFGISENLTTMFSRVFTGLAVATHRFTVQGALDAFVGGRGGAGNVHRSSRIFAMRLDAFEKSASQWNAASIAVGTSDVTIATATVTNPTSAEFLLLGFGAYDAGANSSGIKMFIKEGGGTIHPTGVDGNFSAVSYDATDENHVTALAVPTISATTTFNLIANSQNTDKAMINRSLLVLSMELAGGTPADTVITPTPVTLPIVVPSATVATGNITISPTPVTLPIVVPNLAALTPSLTISPTPVTLPIVVPNATVTPGGITISLTPVVLPIVVPTPTVDFAGFSQTIFPDAVLLPIVVPVATVAVGATTISPTPVLLPIVIPDPVITFPLTISPTPVTLPIVVPGTAVIPADITISPTPVTLPLIIPVHAVQAAGALEFEFFGEALWRVAATEFPTGAVFKVAYVIKVDSISGETARASLLNITTGLVLANSEVTTTATSPTYLVSSAFTLTSGLNDYRPRIGGVSGVAAEYTIYFCMPFISSS